MDADIDYERVGLSVADQFELQGVPGDIPLPNSAEEWDLVLTMLGGRGAEAMRRRVRLVRFQSEVLRRHGFEGAHGALGWDPDLGVTLEGERKSPAE